MKRRKTKPVRKPTRVEQLEGEVQRLAQLNTYLSSTVNQIKNDLTKADARTTARGVEIEDLKARHKREIGDLIGQLHWHKIANENLIDAIAGTELRKRQAEEEQRQRSQSMLERFRHGDRR